MGASGAGSNGGERKPLWNGFWKMLFCFLIGLQVAAILMTIYEVKPERRRAFDLLYAVSPETAIGAYPMEAARSTDPKIRQQHEQRLYQERIRALEAELKTLTKKSSTP